MPAEGRDITGRPGPPHRLRGSTAASEFSNGTVHGVLHLGWVQREGGRYGAQMGVYVKPRGRTGGAYLKLIEPFRHLIVYPALMRQVQRRWAGRTVSGGCAGPASPGCG